MTKYDVIIIGGGPAGISAAIWCADLGLDAVLLERDTELGGQLGAIYGPITNYPGLDLANGEELRGRMMEQVERADIKIRTSAEISSIDIASGRIKLADEDLAARNVVIATGVRRRRLKVPGEQEFVGRGILGSGMRDQGQVEGRNVIIVGGGDAALENALILSNAASKVTLIHRRSHFTAREEFVSRILGRENIEVLLNTNVTHIAGSNQLSRIDVECNSVKRSINCDLLLIRIGVEPNTELFIDQLAVDTSGYLIIDHQCRTSMASVFAIGDVASPLSPTISTAVGMAATAIKVVGSRKFV